MNWKEASTIYLAIALREGAFDPGIENLLHPDSHLLYGFILQFYSKYKELPLAVHIREHFNLDINQEFPTIGRPELLDKMQRERTRYDVQNTILKLQELVTKGEDVSASAYLQPVLDLHNTLTTTGPTLNFPKLSQWRETAAAYISGIANTQIVEYGFKSLDQHTGGIRKGQYIIFYANTGEGKSTFARMIAGNIANQGKTVLYFTLEENAQESVIKTAGTQLHFNASKILENSLSGDTYTTINTTQYKPPGDVIFVDHLEQKTIVELDRFVQNYKPDVIIMDQIPLFTPDGSMKVDDVTRVSRQLKSYTHSSGIPMIALTQATRQARKVSKPTMEDTMAFAYAMCQDGDVVLFLWPNEDGPGYTRKRATLLKNRNHAKGQTLDFKWDLSNGIIEEDQLEYNMQGYGFQGVNVNDRTTPTHTL